MFAARAFAPRYYAPRYFPKTGATAAATTAGPHARTGESGQSAGTWSDGGQGMWGGWW